MRSHRRIRNLTAKPRAQACKPHRFKSFNTDGSLSQATACSNHGHLDLESKARLFAARAATAAQSQPEHRECNPQGRLSCSSQYSIYLDISRYACQILSRVAPIGSWGGWAPGPPPGGGVMYRASRASDIRKQIQQKIGSGTMACDILRPAHDRPRPAPRPASESRCPSSPACEP